jgi:hypothetical protein
VDKEPDDWGLNYSDMIDIVVDSAVAFMLGNSALPPTREEMLNRDPAWLQDVFTVVRLIQFQLDGYSDD